MSTPHARLLLLLIIILALIGLPSCNMPGHDPEPYCGPNMNQWQELKWVQWEGRRVAREARAQGRTLPYMGPPMGCQIYNPYSYVGF